MKTYLLLFLTLKKYQNYVIFCLGNMNIVRNSLNNYYINQNCFSLCKPLMTFYFSIAFIHLGFIFLA